MENGLDFNPYGQDRYKLNQNNFFFFFNIFIFSFRLYLTFRYKQTSISKNMVRNIKSSLLHDYRRFCAV